MKLKLFLMMFVAMVLLAGCKSEEKEVITENDWDHPEEDGRIPPPKY